MNFNYFNFKNQKLKQVLLLFFCVIILSFSMYYHQEKQQIHRINQVSSLNTINEKNISPKELFVNSWQIIKNNYYKQDLNKQNWYKWKKRYINKIKTNEDAIVAINSMLASLDDSYSKFMDSEEFNQQNNAINSKLYGIGVNIASYSGKIYIINVLKDAPAYNSGIKSGDVILKVNNTDISGQSIYHVVQLIRGNLNETISFELLRGNEKILKTVKREEIKIKTIDYKKITEEIGYIRVSSFIGIETVNEFIIALNKLKDLKGLILDLRGNSGGLFQNAIIISNLFMKKGIIVKVIARGGKINTYSATDDGCIYDNPLVVLIDGTSASTTEILSSALQENNRAVLIGTKTYGKGLVQKIFSLPNQSGMNLTIARYLTPKGVDINKKGVSPDYVVQVSHNDLVNNFDSQLDWAKNYLEKKISNKL